MTSQLVGSDFTGGALLPNYVNGRLLVAEDLATAQSSLRVRDTRIGEAAGAGIVRGLWVAGSGTKLKVNSGLAMAHSGSPVLVANTVVLELAFAIASTATNATFACCTSTTDGERSALTTGIYLLTARPACRLEGSAPLAPAPGQTLSPCCAAQWQVEGVEFRVIALPIPKTVDDIAITAGNRRNLIAHWCFGSENLSKLGADPFGFDPAYGGLDTLDPADLTDYDVPLAVFNWDGSEVVELDNWSVRRRITKSDPVPSSWSVTTCDRRVADGQARFLQFQDQADGLVSGSQAASAVASDYFGLLPPVGFLPVHNSHLKALATDALKREQLVGEMVMAKQPVATEMIVDTPSNPPSSAPNYEKMALAAENFLKYKNLLDVADTTVGYGFDPGIFFRGIGRYGGILHWSFAEWALQQSWRLEPVSTQQEGLHVGAPLDEVAFMGKSNTTPTGTEATTATSDAPAGADVTPAPAPAARTDISTKITYYYVAENLDAADSTLADRRASFLDYSSVSYRMGFVRSRLYVVFMANQMWVPGATPPFIAGDTLRYGAGIGQ